MVCLPTFPATADFLPKLGFATADILPNSALRPILRLENTLFRPKLLSKNGSKEEEHQLMELWRIKEAFDMMKSHHSSASLRVLLKWICKRAMLLLVMPEPWGDNWTSSSKMMFANPLYPTCLFATSISSEVRNHLVAPFLIAREPFVESWSNLVIMSLLYSI